MRLLLHDGEKIICAVLFMAMTLLGFVNVVVRYLTNYSFAASEELLTNGFLVLTIFGAAIAARTGDHLAVTMLYDLLPKAGRKIVLAVSGLLVCLLLALSAYFCWQLLMTQIANGIQSYALRIPAWYYSVALPFGFAAVLVRYIQHALETWHALDAEQSPHG